MTVFPAAAIAWARAVLPQPGGPSTMIGFCMRAARYTTCKVTGSITYFAASKRRPRSSRDENTFSSRPILWGSVPYIKLSCHASHPASAAPTCRW